MPPKPYSVIVRAGVFVIGAGLALLVAAAEPRSPRAEPLARALEGVWVQVGTPGHVQPVPEVGGRLKFRSSGQWTYTHADVATGLVKAHFGGVYRVEDDEYVETIDYSTDPDDPELRSTLKFKVKIDGDLMTQTGIGNRYTEVWKRVR